MGLGYGAPAVRVSGLYVMSSLGSTPQDNKWKKKRLLLTLLLTLLTLLLMLLTLLLTLLMLLLMLPMLLIAMQHTSRLH